jgi:indolepyruvate ferredoxin oxidoreductase
MADRELTLESKYRVLSGGVVLTGVQALVRVLFDQIRADRRAGLATGAFVSGYPGSPLGGFDLTLQRTGSLLAEHNVRHVPGVNEDIAATSVWGSQQNGLAPLKNLDGVIGMWYGKSPGVDRSGDVFRQANLHGTGRNGGVLVAAGDDPAAKSSSLPHSSEIALYDAGMPVLVPGSVQDIVDLGRHAYEMSRMSGCWVGFKIVTAVADGLASVAVDPDRIRPAWPEVLDGGRPWRHIQHLRYFVPDTIEMERELHLLRHEAARQYAAANNINTIEVSPAGAWLCIVAAGRTFVETRHALRRLGLGDAELQAGGIRLVKVGMIFPLDRDIIRRAASGVQEVLVIEEKRSFLELFVRDALYGTAGAPRVTGKYDETDRPLVPVDGELNADRLLPILAGRLRSRVQLREPERARTQLSLVAVQPARRATFCSGCPHNRSTIDTSGSPVGGGVGCHAMVMSMDRGAVSYTQMGGEGAQWIGRAPFTQTEHFVQNVGDGTFFHSAILAVRAAVAAEVNVTFKLLFNGVVAMTGGQQAPGQQDVPTVAMALDLEGVRRIIVVSDDPKRFPRRTRWPSRTQVWSRDRLDAAERALADQPGVTALIYDQPCANEMRRLRKRGKAAVQERKVVINEAVCEGCGDCGTKSSCLSVCPVQTELGRKTQVDQTSCNSDYSCLDGDCPSFVTVRARSRFGSGEDRGQQIPEPDRVAQVGADGYAIVTFGVGGTGVTTANQLLSTAAWLDDMQTSGLDQTGLSQKGGPVSSNLRISRTAGGLSNASGASNQVGEGEADLVLALDMIVAADPRLILKADPSRTRMVVSSSLTPTIDMVLGRDDLADTQQLADGLARYCVPAGMSMLDCASISQQTVGDSASANVVLLGAAYQRGLLPMSAASIERAIAVNGVQVAANVAAFRAGRTAMLGPADAPPSVRPGALDRHWSDADEEVARELAARYALSGAVVRRAAELVSYQNAALARRYLGLVAEAGAAEVRMADPASSSLADAVGESFFRLLAYKDEYEVARLYLLPEFMTALRRAIPEAGGLRIMLHPPVLRALGMRRKLALPSAVAFPAFRVLRTMRRLRGTAFDPFGYTSVRRTERRLARDYETEMRAALAELSPASHDLAVALARLPQSIRGYEEIKLESVRGYTAARNELLADLGRQ